MTYLLKNALAEGSEEITSDAVNWLADVMISQDKSEWQETLFHYQVMGFSEDEAFLAAMKEQGRKMLKDGAAGAITGTIMSGGRLAGSKIQDGIQNYRNYKGAVQNGKQYYALNQLTQGGLARSLGNMNVEQSYRSMSPEGKAARPSVDQVYSMLRATGLNHQETQALMKSKGYSVEKGFGQEAMGEPQNVLKKERRGSLDFQGDMAEISDRNRIEKIAESGKINTKKRGINVEIDALTPCLRDVETGEIVDTEYSIVDPSERKGLKKKGWMFNWNSRNLDNSQIYKLTTKGSTELQGLVAIEDNPRSHAFHLSLVESAPQNRNNGTPKKYEGAGGHLFAIAAKKSFEAGYGGFVYFEAANMRLVEHYRKEFGAQWIGRPHEYAMILDEEAAQKLLNTYTFEE